MDALTVLPALAMAGSLSATLGAALGWAATRLRQDEERLVEAIDALLPQSQCGQCNYPGCRPYAAAIARGEAGIDQCPPGGDTTLRELGELLGRETGVRPGLEAAADLRTVATIDESRCIGCALCLPACPVDAIVGAPRLMHTVIASQCTGCGLCIPPCPVDCIDLRPVDAGAARRPPRHAA